ATSSAASAARRSASSATWVRSASETSSAIDEKKYDAVASGSPARWVTARWVVPAAPRSAATSLAARRSASRRAWALGRWRRGPAIGGHASESLEDLPECVLASARPGDVPGTAHQWGSTPHGEVSVRGPVPGQPPAAREGPTARGGRGRAAGHGHRGGRL